MKIVLQFGLGTFRLSGQTVIDSVKTALEVGYRAVDTAQIYTARCTDQSLSPGGDSFGCKVFRPDFQ